MYPPTMGGSARGGQWGQEVCRSCIATPRKMKDQTTCRRQAIEEAWQGPEREETRWRRVLSSGRPGGGEKGHRGGTVTEATARIGGARGRQALNERAKPPVPEAHSLKKTSKRNAPLARGFRGEVAHRLPGPGGGIDRFQEVLVTART